MGARQSLDDQWANVRGPHGFGEMNDAGKEFLLFLSVNEATVCNTWFMKRDINKHTWQHPKSKKWHCIDYAAVRQRDRRLCVDAAVMRGAECHTDHQMLRIKLRAHQTNQLRKQLQKGRKYNVGLLREGKLRDRDSDEVKKEFQHQLSHRIVELWPEERDSIVEKKWSAL